MSVKDKEKAAPAIVISEDEDEAANFFVRKRRRPIVKAAPPIILPSPEQARSEDDSDNEDGPKRRKATKPKKKDNVLPEWAREPMQSQKPRSGSTNADRKGKGKAPAPIVIDSSPEPEAEPSRSKSPALTPPPELTEEEKAKLAQAIRSAYDRPINIDADDAEEADTSSAKVSASAYGDAIRLNFRMVAPPERKQQASAKAIEFYEKKRTITAGRTQPLAYAITAFAGQIRKPPDEIVFTHKDVRIFSKFLTPQALGLDYEADFVCYEVADWDRVQAERAFHDGDEEENADDTRAEEEANASQSSEPVPDIDNKVRITLNGSSGATQAVVQPHVSAKTLCKYYAKKVGLEEGEAADLRLSLDGEMIDPNTKFEEMDIEDGDQVDVVKV